MDYLNCQPSIYVAPQLRTQPTRDPVISNDYLVGGEGQTAIDLNSLNLYFSRVHYNCKFSHSLGGANLKTHMRLNDISLLILLCFNALLLAFAPTSTFNYI